MHDKVMGAEADEDLLANAAQDARDQAEVLREVLGIYPETLTLDDLTREFTVASTEFSEPWTRERVESRMARASGSVARSTPNSSSAAVITETAICSGSSPSSRLKRSTFAGFRASC